MKKFVVAFVAMAAVLSVAPAAEAGGKVGGRDSSWGCGGLC